jgi:hypothetical protein
MLDAVDSQSPTIAWDAQQAGLQAPGAAVLQ